MAKFSFAIPILPGKRAVHDEILEYARTHSDENTRSRERAGITMERVFIMPTPMGEFVVPYVEGARDFAGVLASFQGDDAYDVRFLEKNAEMSGIDFKNATPAPPEPELVAEFIDPQVSDRRKGLAFCAPLAPGRTEAARAFAEEAWTRRRDELTESRRALGITRESVFLNSTPNGDMICVYLEGNDPAEGNRKFAASRTPFDVWFKDECRKVFIPQIDFNDPLPPIATVWDWEAAKVTR